MLLSTGLAQSQCNVLPQSVSTDLTFATELKRAVSGCPEGSAEYEGVCLPIALPSDFLPVPETKPIVHDIPALEILKAFISDTQPSPISTSTGSPNKRSVSAVEVGDIQTIVTATMAVDDTLCFTINSAKSGNASVVLDSPITYEVTLETVLVTYRPTYLYTTEEMTIGSKGACRCWFGSNTCSASSYLCEPDAAACCDIHITSPGQLYCAFGASDLCYGHWATGNGVMHDVYLGNDAPASQSHAMTIRRTRNGVTETSTLWLLPDGPISDNDNILVYINGWANVPPTGLDKFTATVSGTVIYDLSDWNGPTSWNPDRGGWIRENAGVYLYDQAEFCAAGSHGVTQCEGDTFTFAGTFNNNIPIVEYTPPFSEYTSFTNGFIFQAASTTRGDSVLSFAFKEENVGFTYRVARVKNFGCTYLNLLESSQTTDMHCWASGFSVEGTSIFTLFDSENRTLVTTGTNCPINTNCTFELEIPNVPYSPIPVHVCTETVDRGYYCIYYIIELDKIILLNPDFYQTGDGSGSVVDQGQSNWFPSLGLGFSPFVNDLLIILVIVGAVLILLIILFVAYKCRSNSSMKSDGFYLINNNAPPAPLLPSRPDPADVESENSIILDESNEEQMEEVSLKE